MIVNGKVVVVDNVQAAPYKVYTALLSQTGTSAPIATILQNTIGNIIWTRDNTGQYTATLTSAFVHEKTLVITNIGGSTNNITTIKVVVQYPNAVVLSVYDDSHALSDLSTDDSYFPIEIRVYP